MFILSCMIRCATRNSRNLFGHICEFLPKVIMPVTNYKWDGFGALFFKRRYFQGVQRWPTKFVLGCVISPLAAGAISRNLGQAFLPISVCGLSKLVRYKMKCASSQKFFENLAVTEKMSCFWGLNLHPP